MNFELKVEVAPQELALLAKSAADLQTWHRHLCHAGEYSTTELAKNKLVTGLIEYKSGMFIVV